MYAVIFIVKIINDITNMKNRIFKYDHLYLLQKCVHEYEGVLFLVLFTFTFG